MNPIIPVIEDKCSRCHKMFRIIYDGLPMGVLPTGILHSCGNLIAITHNRSEIKFWERDDDGQFQPSMAFKFDAPVIA